MSGVLFNLIARLLPLNETMCAIQQHPQALKCNDASANRENVHVQQHREIELGFDLLSRPFVIIVCESVAGRVRVIVVVRDSRM
jgi:hypothetical protein